MTQNLARKEPKYSGTFIDAQQIRADKIISAARECLGVPFRHQGRTMAGFDCAGVLVHSLKKLGIDYQDQDGYSRNPQNGMLKKILDGQSKLIQVKTMQPGDILLMRITREPQHIAIFTGETIIHSYSTVGKVVEHRLSQEWKQRVKTIYRVIM